MLCGKRSERNTVWCVGLIVKAGDMEGHNVVLLAKEFVLAHGPHAELPHMGFE
jgi:hypothetical protein